MGSWTICPSLWQYGTFSRAISFCQCVKMFLHPFPISPPPRTSYDCVVRREGLCVWVSMRACVSLPPAALTVSRLCWGLSKQSCSQKLLPSLTEQEVDCFVSQGEPLRPRRCCLPLVWLWTHHLVQAISGQSTRCCAVSVRIHARIKPIWSRAVKAGYSIHPLVFQFMSNMWK